MVQLVVIQLNTDAPLVPSNISRSLVLTWDLQSIVLPNSCISQQLRIGNMLNDSCATSNRQFTLVLLRNKSNPVLRGFSDADWGGDLDDRKSTTAYIIFLGDNPISWRTRKQKVVARSSTEAEYRALATTASDIAWIKSLLDELGLKLREPPLLLCDNVGATQLSLNPVIHSRMKHIAIDLV
jgi:hypothetical protein